jgi:hypothetical protein
LSEWWLPAAAVAAYLSLIHEWLPRGLPHANDATPAKAMLNSIFFMISSFLVELRR